MYSQSYLDVLVLVLVLLLLLVLWQWWMRRGYVLHPLAIPQAGLPRR